jgi:hypothetical protein
MKNLVPSAVKKKSSSKARKEIKQSSQRKFEDFILLQSSKIC